MEELSNVTGLIANADLIIKAVLTVLLFQSVFIWYAAIQFIFRMRQVKADRDTMVGALAGASIDSVRQVLQSFAGLRPTGMPAVGNANEASNDDVLNGVWTEVYDLLTARCPGLSTVAATSPFIGLFGTVWGILVAFSSIRTAEAITFSSLAPAIGEALFATMAGLFVAIPSVMANNWMASTSMKLSRQTAQAYMALVEELRSLGRKPGTDAW